MVLNSSRRFSMFLSASCWFSYVLSVLIRSRGSQWFSQVFSGSPRFSVLNVLQCFLLVLIGSQWFLVVVVCSQLFFMVVMRSQWFS